MKVKVQKGNTGESFCCSVKKAKELFKDTDIYLSFAYSEKKYQNYPYSSQNKYVEKNVKGEIVCCISMHTRYTGAILSFYRVKDFEGMNEVIEEFDTKYLPLIYDFFITLFNDPSVILQRKFLCVELYEGKLKLHIIND